MAIRKRQWIAPDGTAKQAWLVDYRDQAGKRRAKQFAKKKDAEAWSVNAAAEVQKGIHTADSVSVTVQKAAELWLGTVRAAGREPTTVAAYDQHVRLHIVPKCGARKLSQLTAPIVRTYLDDWLLHLSRPMALRVFRTFKAILSDAQERGLVAQNVALAVKVQKVKREKGKAHPPPKKDLRAILEAASKAGDLMGRAIIELAVFTGMRASELRGLAWRSVDLKKARVTVEQRADAKGTIGPPKSEAGHRTIALPSRVVQTLREWKLACPDHALGLVFPSPKGKPLSHRVMTLNYVQPIQTEAKVKALGMHAFRHAAASLWIEQGLNPKRIQTLMGHSSIQVTFDTYGHLFEQAQKDAEEADAIAAALFADAT
ncbi:site-specific integrase [Caenibius sp. WL]|uniref:tyrosine-type recombinase/integrase n=1 Tax=Caenibius sp. WL TaxID=2872646 RepID=UPI001C99F64D|nr:site-specific integrase [Caenibius sp. WL]QZP08185.1 site-specific integrase [Caenibius sp. WL]